MSTEERLSVDWELWVVEHLLFASKRDDLVAVLVEQGLDPAQARSQVAALESSPGLARLRLRLGEAQLARRLLRLQSALHPAEVPILPTLSADELLQRHWIPSRPVKLTECARPMAAVRTWSLAELGRRFGAERVQVNERRTEATRAAETEQHVVERAFGDFVEQALSEPSNAAYIVSRCGLLAHPGFRSLWADLDPLPPFLEPTAPPAGVSLWLGPAGTLSPPHFDPHNVLLIQVEGRKRVRLGPRIEAHQHGLLDGYYLRGTLEAAFGDRVLEVELGPGEALFVPVGWFHQVAALDPSLTLSMLNFPWPNHFHWLGPVGSDDAR